MDFGKIISSDTSEMTVRHPKTGAETDTVLTIYGPDTRKYRRAQRDFIVAQMAVKDDGDDKEIEDAFNVFMAKLIAKWENVAIDDEQLECNYENAMKVIEIAPYVARQIDQHTSNLGNYYTEQPKS